MVSAVADANCSGWPKAVRFEYFIFSGAANKMLHVWFHLVGSSRGEQMRKRLVMQRY
jgi:hypothetical protein